MNPFDFDHARSASYVHQVEHLTVPFAAGAVDIDLAVEIDGTAAVDLSAREPLLLVAPRRDLDSIGMRVRVIATPVDGPAVTTDLDFAPYTEARAFLPAHRPEVGAVTRLASPLVLALSVFEGEASTPIEPALVGERLEVRLLQGIFGRMIYALSAEKLRMRRVAREIAAMRRLATARGDALDRIGAELGVARFADELSFEATSANPAGEIVMKARREPDDELRRRLRIYRPFHAPTRGRALELLNGPGEPSDPNAGLLGEMGLEARFTLVEEDNPFALAVLVVAGAQTVPAAALMLSRFHAHLRAWRLVEPAADVPATRFLPAAERAREQAQRERLRVAFGFAAGQHVAPAVAAALDRLGRCRAALGASTPWPILRAHEPSEASRYQLGLGVDVPLPAAAELDALANAVLSAAWDPATDAETVGTLRASEPALAADDPKGTWLLSACGLRTAHAFDGTSMYLSPLPTAGLVVTPVAGPAFRTADRLELDAVYNAEGDPGAHALLVTGMAEASAAWLDAGGEAWTPVPSASNATELAQVVALSPASRDVLKAGGLAVPDDLPSLVSALGSVSPQLFQLVELAPSFSAQILAADTAAIPTLATLGGTFANVGLASMLAVRTSNRIVLVVAVIGLPQVGANLSGRRTAGFRWYATPFSGEAVSIKPVGSKTSLAAPTPGLSTVVAVGYARSGLTDPYQFRADLPDGAVLTLAQYELLMNTLEYLCPVGVGVHTFDLRQGHVDLDGDGAAAPLPAKLARTFRAFRNRRQLGESDFGNEPT